MKCFFCEKDLPNQDFIREFADGTTLTYNKCITCRKNYVEKAVASGRKKGWEKSVEIRKKKAIERKEIELEKLKSSVKN